MRDVIQTGTGFNGVAGGVWWKRAGWICLLLFASLSASALEVQEVRWGFDGQVVPGRFNILSVLVANPSGIPFDVTMKFSKSRGLSDRVGALYGMPCYVSPMTARWLQFYVFVDNTYDHWRLEWGRKPNEQQELDPPKWSSPAQVLLTDSETILTGGSAFKQFPEELLPPAVSAMSGLDSVLLDHAPHWEPAKRRAFLNWLRAGGKVHLLLGADGRYPFFADELSVLNSSEDHLRLGAGWVTRHAATARDIRKQDVQSPAEPSRGTNDDEQSISMQTDSFLRALAQFSQRHYNWTGIYLLAFAYLALVGPGNFLAGRKLSDYRLRIGLLLATVAAFAFFFNFVGRRGLGETNVVHSLSYARAVDGDIYDVMQWVNVFAARGSHYTITHTSPHNLYSTGQDYESVNGIIESGKDGQFIVDIPMFSRRAFLHAADMKGPNIPVKVVTWDATTKLKKLTVSLGPDFSKQVVSGWLVQGDRVYSAKLTKDGVAFDDANAEPLNNYIASMPVPMMYEGNNGNKAINVEEGFQNLAKPLLAWSLGGRNHSSQRAIFTDGSQAQLFLFMRSPQSFSISGSALGREVGYVLYQFNVFKPGTEGKP